MTPKPGWVDGRVDQWLQPGGMATTDFRNCYRLSRFYVEAPWMRAAL